MKKIFTISLIPNILIGTVFPIISCSSNPDYKVMSWSIDKNKLNQNLVSELNNKPVTEDLLKMIIKSKTNENGNEEFYIDRYTQEAIAQGWFKNVIAKFNNGKTIVIIEMKDKNQNNKSNPYRLPNGSLKMES